MSYLELLVKNRKGLEVELMRIIDNKTLYNYYSIKTNLHVDLGLSLDGSLYTHWYGTSKKQFNRVVYEFKKELHCSFKLARTDNDNSYTRIIYNLKSKNK